jgi:membrane protein implicated in regulation of membrane protease activity
MRSMPSLESLADLKFTIGAALGLVLIVLARLASRTRGSKLDSWVAFRVGDVLLTEVVGAFLLGYGIGGLVSQPDAAAGGGRPGGIQIGGRFGRFGGAGGAGLPFTLAIVGAAIAVLTRLDLGALLLRGSSSPGNGLSTYIGSEANVIAPISAGGYGQIAMRDGMGYPVSAVATAETDIAEGAPVKVIGTKGRNLLVAPVLKS